MEKQSQEFDPGPIGALTLEQKEVFKLLARGIARPEIASQRQAQTEEIFDVIKSVNEMLEVSDSAASIYILLKKGEIHLSDSDVNAAKDKISMLNQEQKDILRMMMAGYDSDRIAELTGMSYESLRLELHDIVAAIHSRSPEHTVQMAYAAGLDKEEVLVEPEYFVSELIENETTPELELEADLEPELELGPGQEIELREQLMPEAASNIMKFVEWMYPKYDSSRVVLDENSMIAVRQAIKDGLQEYVDSLPKPKQKKQMKPAVGYIDKWLDGNSVARIAEEAGKLDGSVRLSLSGLAERLGGRIPLESLTEEK